MIRRTLVLGALLVALGCANSEPLSPSGTDSPLLQRTPADGNGSKQVIAADFAFPVDCGTETISGHIVAWFQIRSFEPGTRNVELLVAHALFTMTNAAGESFTWREVGIDHWSIDQDGNLLHAINGRAGDPGIIGRLVLNETTGVPEFVAGNEVGNTFVNACADLT